jgi:hypothetical protein
MTAAAANLPRSPLYGIAGWHAGTEHIEYEIGWDEFERDVDWAESVLKATGLRSGDIALITAQNCEGPWISPVVRALRRLGVTYACAEVWSFDARRTSMFLQQLPIRAVFGLCGDTVAALEPEQPPLPELLANVDFLWARPDALAKVSGLARAVMPLVMLGPALGLGVPGQPGAVVNPDEWTVDTEDGQLVISNVRDRAATFDRAPTDVRGHVLSEVDGTIAIDLDEDAARS